AERLRFRPARDRRACLRGRGAGAHHPRAGLRLGARGGAPLAGGGVTPTGRPLTVRADPSFRPPFRPVSTLLGVSLMVTADDFAIAVREYRLEAEDALHALLTLLDAPPRVDGGREAYRRVERVLLDLRRALIPLTAEDE